MGRIPAAARRAAREERQRAPTRTTTSRRARRCSICSASAIRPALSHLALGRLVAETGARSVAERHLEQGARRSSSSSAPNATSTTPRAAQALLTTIGTGEYVISPADADDAIVRRIVDAAALPDLLGRETAAALLEAAAGDCGVVFVELAGGDVRVVASAGCDADAARDAGARRPSHGSAYGRGAHRRRAARPRRRRAAVRPGRVAAADRPSGDAPAADDRRGRAAGLRAVRRARSTRRRSAGLAVDPVARAAAARDSSPPAPR